MRIIFINSYFAPRTLGGAEQKLFNIVDGLFNRRHVVDSDELLAGLYANATALLYPSAFEGFGLPLLEAMIYDCPIVTSPLSAM